MDARLLVRSKFMVSHEFGTGDIPKEPLVTIASVKKPDEEEELTKNWWLVYFVEPWAKPLKVNTTHRDALALMFGWETDDWKGKRIGLYAMVGTFFGKRQTAVRIKGSPDLKEPRSFQVRKLSGGRDTYNLVPMAQPGSAPAPSGNSNGAAAPYVPGVVRSGPKRGSNIAEITHQELADTITLYRTELGKAPAGKFKDTRRNLEELEAEQLRREKIEQQIASGQPPPAAATSDLVEESTEDAPF